MKRMKTRSYLSLILIFCFCFITIVSSHAENFPQWFDELDGVVVQTLTISKSELKKLESLYFEIDGALVSTVTDKKASAVTVSFYGGRENELLLEKQEEDGSLRVLAISKNSSSVTITLPENYTIETSLCIANGELIAFLPNSNKFQFNLTIDAKENSKVSIESSSFESPGLNMPVTCKIAESAAILLSVALKELNVENNGMLYTEYPTENLNISGYGKHYTPETAEGIFYENLPSDVIEFGAIVEEVSGKEFTSVKVLSNGFTVTVKYDDIESAKLILFGYSRNPDNLRIVTEMEGETLLVFADSDQIDELTALTFLTVVLPLNVAYERLFYVLSGGSMDVELPLKYKTAPKTIAYANVGKMTFRGNTVNMNNVTAVVDENGSIDFDVKSIKNHQLMNNGLVQLPKQVNIEDLLITSKGVYIIK